VTDENAADQQEYEDVGIYLPVIKSKKAMFIKHPVIEHLILSHLPN